mmetsp:Transcript_146508/g.470002  ORF Transcript_146508/g.470002 Transcript_146508/m.470002 type:complete len:202 (+) Transcript_146508:193-798(+)
MGVSPCAFLASTDAPDFTNRVMSSTSPRLAARCRAVEPSMVASSMVHRRPPLPIMVRIRTALKKDFQTQPVDFQGTFGSQPFCSSSCAASMSGSSQRAMRQSRVPSPPQRRAWRTSIPLSMNCWRIAALLTPVRALRQQGLMPSNLSFLSTSHSGNRCNQPTTFSVLPRQLARNRQSMALAFLWYGSALASRSASTVGKSA